MAVVNEQLVIDVSARDALTAHIEKMTGAIESFGDTAKKQIDATNKVLVKLPDAVAKTGDEVEKTEKKVVSFADVATKKFAALGKAAVGIFAADLAAKVLGFGSALEVVRDVADALAKSIRGIFMNDRTDFLRQLGMATVQAESLATALDKIKAADLAQRREYRIQGVAGPILDERASVSLAKSGLSDVGFEAALRSLGQIQAQYQALETQIADAAANWSRSYDENLVIVRGLQAEQQTLLSKVPTFIEEIIAADDKLRESRIESARASEIVLDLRKREREEGAKSLKQFEAEIAAQLRANSYAGIAGGRGARVTAAAAGRAYEAQRRTTLLGDRFGVPSFTQETLPEGTPSGRSPFGVSSFTRDFAGGLSGLIEKGVGGLVNLTDQFIAAAKAKGEFDRSFKGGAALTFAQMKEDIDASLGSQAVMGAFNGLRGFFSDVVTGAKSGSEAIADFGRSIVSLGADILAQKFALQVLGVFGISAPGTQFAKGGVVRGGINAPGVPSYASGGVAYGPQLAMIGDNRAQTEAVVPMPDGRSIPVQMRGGGGNSVQINLNVSAIDGPGAASAVARMMPEIEGRIMAALSGGNRGLQMAVRGA